jgi:hypothetical protein
MLTYFFAWFPMVAIAVGNGLLRDLVYGRRLRELLAHQLSTLSGVILLGIYMGWAMALWPPDSAGQAIRIGLMWSLMTVVFEFGFGHYGAGHTWKHLLQDYNVRAGRVWPAILIWVAFAPYLFYLVQQ